jgi:hypothetical protein
MSGPRTPGWIYVLASQSHPGIVKIGRTSQNRDVTTTMRMMTATARTVIAWPIWT